jgi:hypothetical protein
MKKVTRIVSKGVGLAAEAIEDHKQRKRSLAPSGSIAAGATEIEPSVAESSSRGIQEKWEKYEDDSDSETDSVEDDEEVWELDEAVPPPSDDDVMSEGVRRDISTDRVPQSGAGKVSKVDALVARLASPPPRFRDDHGELIGALPCPVVLPNADRGLKQEGLCERMHQFS